MGNERSKSIWRLFLLIVSTSNFLYGILGGIAVFIVYRYPNSEGNVMVAIFAITSVFSIASSIILFIIARPWREDFSFFSKKDVVDKRIDELIDSNKQIIERLEGIEIKIGM